MKHFMKHIKRLLLVLVVVVFTAVPAFGAEKIKEVTIEVTDEGEDYPCIKAEEANCYIEEIIWNKEEEVKIGDQIRATLKFKAHRGYEFKIKRNEQIILSGTGKENSEVMLYSEGNEMTVIVFYTIEGIPENPGNAYWEGTEAMAERSPNALWYEFKLFSPKGKVVATKKSYSPKFNFCEELNQRGIAGKDGVYFTVCAVRGDEEEENVTYRSEEISSDDYEEWDELRDFCHRVGVKWNGK